ncbi:MAG: UDP-N-acetylglucosamine pyrophosphorylase [Clostridia bacterium]|nr:UDP-N-acetylglucosamine pyrophosphorylase [Clostridia bacterium]
MEIGDLYNLEETIAKELLITEKYPWEILPKINDFILKLGPKLDKNIYEQKGKNVWIAKSAKVAPTASITGPVIIDEDAEIRHSAFIRGKAIVGKNTVVGNSTELKNVILFNNVQVPHYNYVGDSILGYKAHMGAGSLTTNLKSDKSNVQIKIKVAKKGIENINTNGILNKANQNEEKNTNYIEEKIETNLRKVGAFLGDGVEVGCNSVLNPGTIIGKNTNIYPLSCVRGVIPENSIYKNQNEIVEKK